MTRRNLILDLKRDFTIVIVTHNMQQAARISDYTAFFYLSELIEYDMTNTIFTYPAAKQTEDNVTTVSAEPSSRSTHLSYVRPL